MREAINSILQMGTLGVEAEWRNILPKVIQPSVAETLLIPPAGGLRGHGISELTVE